MSGQGTLLAERQVVLRCRRVFEPSAALVAGSSAVLVEGVPHSSTVSDEIGEVICDEDEHNGYSRPCGSELHQAAAHQPGSRQVVKAVQQVAHGQPYSSTQLARLDIQLALQEAVWQFADHTGEAKEKAEAPRSYGRIIAVLQSPHWVQSMTDFGLQCHYHGCAERSSENPADGLVVPEEPPSPQGEPPVDWLSKAARPAIAVA
jgi:hypothetical protein